MAVKNSLISLFQYKRVVIGIIGLGYVGLPLMLRYAEVAYKVLGFDIDQDKIGKLKAEKSYI